ncbi:MAG: diguanylate cyclase domain-containing protein [Coriobacteriia bacterium]
MLLLAIVGIILFWLTVSFVHGVLSPDGRGFIADLIDPDSSSLAMRGFVALMIVGGAFYTQRLLDEHIGTAQELDHARYKLELVYDNNPDAILIIDSDYTVTYANPEAEKLTGVAADDMLGKRCYEAILDAEGPCDSCRVDGVLRSGVPTVGVKHEKTAAGREHWVERMWYPVFTNEGAVESVVEISKDITDIKRAEFAMQEYSEDLEESVRVRTEELEKSNEDLQEEIAERRRAEKALRESEERFRSLVELAPDLILVHIEGIISFINPYGARLLGYTDPSELLGTHVMELVDPDSRDGASAQLRTTVRERKAIPPTELRFIRKGGSTVDVQIAATPLMYHGRPAVQAVAHDITDRKRAEDTIRKMAYYDMLTGLPNRALFDDRLAVAIGHAERDDHSFAVMFMDMNDFKLVNDTLGHNVGDELLAEVAKRLGRVVRRSDTVARLGGDEFTVLLPKVSTRKAAALVARKITQVMDEPVLTDKGAVPIDLSIGIAFYPSDGKSFSELMYAADMAMYACKNEGTPFRFADPGIFSGGAPAS